MGAFEDFVIAELPLRQVLKSVSSDPSTGDGVAASVGTYVIDSSNVRWTKYSTGNTDWRKVDFKADTSYDLLSSYTTDINIGGIIDSNNTGNLLYIDKSEYKIGIGTSSPSVILDIGSDTGAIKFPIGTTAQQPVNAAGLFRFNVSTSQFEGNDGSGWTGVGGVTDSDQDTKVVASSAGDDDTLVMWISGSPMLTLSAHSEKTGDTVGQLGALRPYWDGRIDIGGPGNEFRDLWIDGTANIDSLVADVVDINSGNIDNTVIGNALPAVGKFSGITVYGELSALERVTTDYVTVSSDLYVAGDAAFPALSSGGGTINSTVIGNRFPAAANFSSIDMGGNNITEVGQISLDTITADGSDITVQLDDNRGNAFTVKEGATTYMSIKTSDDQEKIEFPDNSTVFSIRTYGNPVIGTNFQIGGGTLAGITIATIDNIRIDGSNIGHTTAPQLLKLESEYLTLSGGLSARGPITVGDGTNAAYLSGALGVEGDVWITGGNTLKIGNSLSTYLLMGDGINGYKASAVEGTVTFAWVGNKITTSIANNAITLGTHTVGQYVQKLDTASTGITITNNGDNNAGIAEAIAPKIVVDYGHDPNEAVEGDTILKVQGTTNEVDVTYGNTDTHMLMGSGGTITIGLPDNVSIAGNLTVGGGTTTVNTANLTVEDPLIQLAKSNDETDIVDIGFYGLYDTSGSLDLYTGLFRDANDSGRWKLFKDNQAVPGTTVDVAGTGYATATLVAHLEDSSTTITGGTVNNTTVGATTPAAGTFTDLVANDSLTVNAGASIIGDTTNEVTLNVKGVGSQTASLFNVEQSDGTDKLTISSAGLTTIASVDINAGAIDNTTIGKDVQASLSATNITSTGTISAKGTTTPNYFAGNVGIGTTEPAAKLHTVDGAIIFEHSSSNLLVDFESNDSAILNFSAVGAGESTIFRTNRYFKFDTGDTANALVIKASGRVGIGTGAPTELLTVAGNVSARGDITASGGAIGTPHTPDASITFSISSTDAIKIPVGDCDERPAGLTHSGYVRYNSEFGIFEGYEGSYWTGLGGVIDVDRDTRVLAEVTPGQDDDTLFFHTGGTNRLSISAAVVKPHADNTIDFGTADNQIKDIYVHGIGYIDQIGTSGDPSNAGYFTDLQTEQYVKHIGDTNTSIEFETDTFKINVGGVVQLSAVTTGTVINDSMAGSSFRVQSEQDTSALFVSGANVQVGIGTDSPTVGLVINTTDAIQVPVGTTVQQPGKSDEAAAATGMVRYNTTTNSFEGYLNTGWGSLGGVTDVDKDTTIHAEKSADEDKLRFDTAGSERMIITDQGLVGIGTSDPQYELSVFGSISSDSVIYASGGNSLDWDSVYTTTNVYSASWDSTNTTLSDISGNSWFHSTSAGALGRHITATHDLTAGMAARQNADGSWVKSVAASLPVNGLETDVLSAEVLGIVQYSNANIDADIPTGTEFEIIHSGICNLPSHELGDPGATLFLSPITLGRLTSACITSDYQIDKPVGTILDDDTILVQPFRGIKLNPMPNNEDDWDAAYTTVNSYSSNWSGGDTASIYTTLNVGSASWYSTNTDVNVNSASWDSTNTDVNANSGLWGATYTTIGSHSGDWETAHGDRLKWDGGATGLIAGTGRTSLGLGTIATQAAGGVAITGGTIDGTTVGSTTPAAGAFTTLKVTTPGSAPASAAATGTKGDIRYDDNYIYICVQTDTWKRSVLATWS